MKINYKNLMLRIIFLESRVRTLQSKNQELLDLVAELKEKNFKWRWK